MSADSGARDRWRLQAAEVKARIPLSTLIGRVVKLAKAGREYKGLCPFHDERSPSFTVVDDKGFYQCFGCGAHGDAVDFLMATQGVTFGEAVQMLADGAGISVDALARDPDAIAAAERRRARQEREAAEAAEKRRLNAVGLWQAAQPMRGTPAQYYLEARAIDFARLGRFPGAIRYRPDCWHGPLGIALPAMVTAVIRNGVHIATHRTFLECRNGTWGKIHRALPASAGGGARARRADAKMVLGSFAGGHIPISKGARREPLHRIAPGTAVFVSEGIEDALTVAMLDPSLRVIAGVALPNLGNALLPQQAGDFVFIGQRDPDGSGAQRQFEARIAQQQALADADAAAFGGQPRRVRAIWPDAGYKDFNEALRGVRMAGKGAN